MDDPNLSKVEKRILQVAMRSGQSNRLTMEDIAGQIGRSVEFVYNKLMDTSFRSLFFEALRTTISAEVPAILQKFVELGREGSFKHGKLILELSGMYNEATNIKLDATIHSGESLFKNDDEKEAFIRATLDKYIDQPEEED